MLHKSKVVEHIIKKYMKTDFVFHIYTAAVVVFNLLFLPSLFLILFCRYLRGCNKEALKLLAPVEEGWTLPSSVNMYLGENSEGHLVHPLSFE